MKLYLAVTDNNWYHYLLQLKPDEINFWQPGGKTGFKVFDPGTTLFSVQLLVINKNSGAWWSSLLGTEGRF